MFIHKDLIHFIHKNQSVQNPFKKDYQRWEAMTLPNTLEVCQVEIHSCCKYLEKKLMCLGGYFTVAQAYCSLPVIRQNVMNRAMQWSELADRNQGEKTLKHYRHDTALDDIHLET